MDKKYFKPININLPIHNVMILSSCLKVQFNIDKENGIFTYFYINSEYGFLNREKNGFWYFTIVIEPHREYQYYNGISESYIKVRGELLAEHIKMLQNIENKQYT